MEQVDEAYLEELLASTGENRNENKNEHKTDSNDNTTYDDIKEMAKKMGCGDREHDMNVITKFIEVSVYKIFFLSHIARVYMMEGLQVLSMVVVVVIL